MDLRIKFINNETIKLEENVGEYLTDWEWKDFLNIKAIEKNHTCTGFGCREFKFLEFRHQAEFRKYLDNWQKILSVYITNS